jgi:hypothetical protein
MKELKKKEVAREWLPLHFRSKGEKVSELYFDPMTTYASHLSLWTRKNPLGNLPKPTKPRHLGSVFPQFCDVAFIMRVGYIKTGVSKSLKLKLNFKALSMLKKL